MTIVPGLDAFEAEASFDAELQGTVNGKPISLSGSGTYDTNVGLTVGEYDLHELPEGFSPFLLGVCLVTGYPNVCACEGRASSPFGTAPYRYIRSISLGKFGRLRLNTSVNYSGLHLISRFYLEGDVTVPSLGQVEPFEETWEIGQDGIAGNFVMRWPISRRMSVEASAESRYFPSNPPHSIDRMVRSFLLRMELTGRRLKLHQESALRA